MWVRLSKNRDLAVRPDHRRRMLENPFEVRLVDGVKDPAAPSIFDDPQSSFGSVFNRRLGSAQAGHIGQILPGKRFIPTAAGYDDILRVASASLVFDDPDCLCFYLRADGRILEPILYFSSTAFLRP